MTKLDVIENESILNRLQPEWSGLASNATPMQSPLWMLNWWQAHRTPQDRLCVLVVRSEDDDLIGLVPWYRHATVALGTSLRFLGSGRACSDYQTILCQPGTEESVVRCVAQWLSERGRAAASKSSPPKVPWDLLDLEGVSQSDTVMQKFIETLADRGHVTHRRASESTWRIDLSGGWDGFMSRQSKTQRSQTRNFVNRFDKSSDLQLRIASQETGHAEALVAALIELHQMRWRAVGGEGCFADRRMKSFFENAMRDMIAAGCADVVVLRREQRPVAAQGWLIQDGSIYAYQSGRDPAEDANRVGRIANSIALRWACERGFQSIDFLRGDESYKSKMRAEPTLSHRVRIVAKASVPELRHKLWLACREVKSRLQDLRKPNAVRPDESSEEATSAAAD